MYGKVTHSARLFAALNVFFVITLFSWMLSAQAGLSFPVYAPEAGAESVLGMALYARLAFSLVLGAAAGLLLYVLVPFLHETLEIRLKTFKNFSTFAVLLAISSAVAVSWPPWLPSGEGFWDLHALLFFLVFLLFLSLLLLVLAVEKKIHE